MHTCIWLNCIELSNHASYFHHHLSMHMHVHVHVCSSISDCVEAVCIAMLYFILDCFNEFTTACDLAELAS